jgi:ethanolamine ammonia-lyase large subunit
MLNYQSTSFHDALAVRAALGKRPAPEFAAWLDQVGIGTDGVAIPPSLSPALIGLG